MRRLLATRPRARLDIGFVRLLVSTLGLLLATGACSLLPGDTAVLIVHNRSAVPIALYPGAIIEPCSEVEFDRGAVNAGNARLNQAMDSDPEHSWVPRGAVRFSRGISGRPVGSTEPMTVVVSAGEPHQQLGRIAPGELPACGGEPVGID